MYDYDWLGHGLEISTPTGSLFLQGDEASALYDELEACSTAEQVEAILCEYEGACDE